VHHSFFTIRDNLNIDNYKKRIVEIDYIHLKTYLNTFVSNMLLTLQIMNFENVFLAKVIHFYVIQNMDA
jgi:hypothetical protein